MGRLRRLTIENYRSIGDEVMIDFPVSVPLVLVGENNAGKSNIVRGMELLLGEMWPGSHEPGDHEFFGRNRANGAITIRADLEGVKNHTSGSYHGRAVAALRWTYDGAASGGQRPFVAELDDGREYSFISNETREQCLCIVVGADRRLSHQLSYASRYTLLSKVMRRFHQCLTADTERVAALRARFEETERLFREVEEFRTFTDTLQTQVSELAGNLSYGLGVDFSAYDPSNFFHALRVFPHESGEARTLEELGTGQEQLLAVSLAYAYATAFRQTSSLFLVIEEPEAHLHPLAQQWLGTKIRELARTGVQVVVTTHSPYFLDILGLEGLVLVRKREGSTCVVQLNVEQLAAHCRQAGAARADAATLLPFYAAAVTQEILAGFFARKVVLVEGPTEALALSVYLAKAGLHVEREGIAVVPVTGVGNLAKWWRLFTAYQISTYVIWDNDRKDDRDGHKRDDLMASLHIGPEQAEQLKLADDLVIDHRGAVFGSNFETTMRQLFEPDYTQLEEQAREQHGLTQGQSKPLVARFVADQLDVEAHPEGARRLRELADRIAAVK